MQAVEVRTDPLTQLANRRALDDELHARAGEAQRLGRPLAMVMLDVDHFKQFNDRFGHQAGDDVLRGLGAALARTVGTAGLAARYGGEEMAVVLPGMKVEQAGALAEQIRRAVAQLAFCFNQAPVQVTVSAGAAGWKSAKTARPRCGGPTTPCMPPSTPAATAPLARRRRRPSGPTRACPRPAAPAAAGGNLPDRAAFHAELTRHLAGWNWNSRPVSVLLVEIHNYLELFARHGHTAIVQGEATDGATAEQLAGRLRPVGLVDHATFAVLLPEKNAAAARKQAERLRKRAEEHGFTLSGRPARLTLNLGGTEVSSGDDADIVLGRRRGPGHSRPDRRELRPLRSACPPRAGALAVNYRLA